MKYSRVRGLTVIIAAFLCFALPALAQNIIGFADNANACGSATICSTNGTAGYLNNGTGQAFDLSTINSWFQIDVAPNGMSSATNQLPTTQTMAEPDGGAGNFLVVNNTGAVVTSFSLTITDNFTSSTPSVVGCGSSICDKFSIHGGAANYFSNLSLSGPDCVSGCGTDQASFTPGTVTYAWSCSTPGCGVPIGAKFDLNFASWNNGSVAVAEGSGVPMLAASGLVLLGTIALKRRSNLG